MKAYKTFIIHQRLILETIFNYSNIKKIKNSLSLQHKYQIKISN